jgi:hypothetical protein
MAAPRLIFMPVLSQAFLVLLRAQIARRLLDPGARSLAVVAALARQAQPGIGAVLVTPAAFSGKIA